MRTIQSQNARTATTAVGELVSVEVMTGDGPVVDRGRQGRRVVLIAEDDMKLADNLAEIAAIAGYDAILVTRAADALWEVESGGVDAIITDDHLDDMSGVDLLATLRRHGQHLPAVLMTGWCDCAAGAPPSAGAVFTPKPFDSARLLSVLESFRLRPNVAGLSPVRSTGCGGAHRRAFLSEA